MLMQVLQLLMAEPEEPAAWAPFREKEEQPAWERCLKPGTEVLGELAPWQGEGAEFAEPEVLARHSVREPALAEPAAWAPQMEQALV
ncbi:MAG: hypothetical protein PHV34_20010 [Verrucomicrobiae bacterium]|nr:hypothetical protein [Verrucomicrobiae bacterium]